jgi:hypothetical protein
MTESSPATRWCSIHRSILARAAEYRSAPQTTLPPHSPSIRETAIRKVRGNGIAHGA